MSNSNSLYVFNSSSKERKLGKIIDAVSCGKFTVSISPSNLIIKPARGNRMKSISAKKISKAKVANFEIRRSQIHWTVKFELTYFQN